MLRTVVIRFKIFAGNLVTVILIFVIVVIIVIVAVIVVIIITCFALANGDETVATTASPRVVEGVQKYEKFIKVAAHSK